MRRSLVWYSLSLLQASVRAAWPDKPFTTSGRDIISASGETVVYAGVNWPGAADVMIPEGLQYASISDAVSKFKSLGINAIRLTYAIEMIDDILDNGGDVTIADALTKALGSENGTIVLNEILTQNPQFTNSTTRLQTFDAVAEECANQEIYVHLDNHVSKGEWCCSLTDGNAWWGDTYFDAAKWRRGLAYMADHGKDWTALTSMSLRNELREPTDNATADATYNWPTWYNNTISGAEGIYAANPSPLIFFSGLGYDTDLSAPVDGTDLGNGVYFNKSSLDFGDKLVWELHNYENSATDCSSIQSTLYNGGYKAMNLSDPTVGEGNYGPVVLTEFGFAQDAADYSGVYAQCLKDWLEDWKGGWMAWVLAGGYYIRSGVQDVEDTWGLLNKQWSDWRDTSDLMSYYPELINATATN